MLVWADVLGQASAGAQAPFRDLVLMAVAGVIAAFGVRNGGRHSHRRRDGDQPLPAADHRSLHRPRPAPAVIVVRGLGTLVVGALRHVLARRCVTVRSASSSSSRWLRPRRVPAGQTEINGTTVIVAFAAGVAGMLAVETRSGAAVGVAISVSTIPAAAYLGVSAGIGAPADVMVGARRPGDEHRDDARRRHDRPRRAATHPDRAPRSEIAAVALRQGPPDQA